MTDNYTTKEWNHHRIDRANFKSDHTEKKQVIRKYHLPQEAHYIGYLNLCAKAKEMFISLEMPSVSFWR